MGLAMKEMSIDNLDLIAQGGMGKIYRINDEQILKVFNCITLEELKKQKESAVEVFKAMVPTAISFEMVRVGDKYGIIYEFLNATSVGKALADHPEKKDEAQKFITKFAKNANYNAIHEPALASKLYNDFKSNFLKEE